MTDEPTPPAPEPSPRRRRPRIADVRVDPDQPLTEPADSLVGPDPVMLTLGVSDARWIAFIRHYVRTGNGTQAALAAGYPPSDAANRAYRLLRHPKVAAAIKHLLDRYDITRDRVLQEIAHRAFGHIGDVVDWDETGIRPIPKREMAVAAQKLIEEIEETPGEYGTKRRIRVRDAKPYLELAAKLTGVVPPSSGKVTFPDGTTVEGGEYAPITIYQLPDNGRLTAPGPGRSLTSGPPVNGGPPSPDTPEH